jgi:ABC-2 type transport system ATP-binding protein
VPAGVALPALPGVVQAGSVRLPVLTTSRYEPALAAAYQHAGATVRAVEPMTLEEIFVANVQDRREREAS